MNLNMVSSSSVLDLTSLSSSSSSSSSTSSSASTPHTHPTTTTDTTGMSSTTISKDNPTFLPTSQKVSIFTIVSNHLSESEPALEHLPTLQSSDHQQNSADNLNPQGAFLSSKSSSLSPRVASDDFFSIHASAHPMSLALSPKVDMGFFLCDQDWTCYRRNYFKFSISFTIQSQDAPSAASSCSPTFVSIPSLPYMLKIQCWSSTVSARSANGSREIELIQHTAKRDKGPISKPGWKGILPTSTPLSLPSPSPSGTSLSNSPQHERLNLISSSSSSPSSQFYSQLKLQVQQSQPSHQSVAAVTPDPTNSQQHPYKMIQELAWLNPTKYECVFERLQFRGATANNGRRRAAQQYHVLVGEIWAIVDAKEMVRAVEHAMMMDQQQEEQQQQNQHSELTSSRLESRDMKNEGFLLPQNHLFQYDDSDDDEDERYKGQLNSDFGYQGERPIGANTNLDDQVNLIADVDDGNDADEELQGVEVDLTKYKDINHVVNLLKEAGGVSIGDELFAFKVAVSESVPVSLNLHHYINIDDINIHVLSIFFRLFFSFFRINRL